MDIQLRGIDGLTLDPANARNHSARNIAAISESLSRFGQRRPAVIRSDGTVLAGNGMVEAALGLGWSEVAVTVVPDGWSPEEARAYALADNRTAELAEWDQDVLRSHLVELEVAGWDVDALGFDVPEVLPSEAVEDDVPKLPVTPVTVAGDIWMLGKHRVMCGDATSDADTLLLFDGQTVDICFTSPPYALGKNISLSGNKAMSKKASAYDSHKDETHLWAGLMRDWLEASRSVVTDGWFVNVQPLANNKRDLFRWITDNVERLTDVITWDKGHAAPQMAPGVLTSRFEWIVVMGKNNATRTIPMSSWRGTMSNVYSAPPQRGNEFSGEHGATMPTHLPIWIMSELADECRSVYDPFMGTGTTLIAANDVGRVAFGMEISPAYCDIICERFERRSGVVPHRIGDANPYSFVGSSDG